MSDRAKNPSWQIEDLEPEQTRESAKWTVATQLAREISQDTGFFRRPERGRAHLEVPREEIRAPTYELTYKQWHDRNRSRELSVHRGTSEDNIDYEKPMKSFFLVPYEPTDFFLLESVYENGLYNTLSAGGTRIAFIGEDGVGYGISACKVPCTSNADF
jgi:hypothetical protein